MLFAVSLLCAGPGADLAELTAGVTKVAQAGVPGVVCAIAPEAVPFVAAGKSDPRAMAVAARFGRGRVAAFGHGGYLDAGTSRRDDTGRLMQNTIRWVGAKASPTIGILEGAAAGEAMAKELGFRTIRVTPRTLGDADVLLMTRPSALSEVRRFLTRGGGLIVADTPWGWMQIHRATTLLGEFGWNEFLAPAGIVFNDGYLDGPRPVSSIEECESLNASLALSRLETQPKGSYIVQTALQFSPPNVPLFRRLRTRLANSPRKVPTAADPIRATDTWPRLGLFVDQIDRQSGKKRLSADPSAASFPGAVPVSAKRTSGSLTLTVAIGRWASTGFYAAPGETIALQVPHDLADKGFRLQIGVHSDTNWHHQEWKRHPEIIASAAVRTPRTTLTSPFGGLVIVSVPDGLKLPPQPIRIENVIAAPRFILGETSAADFRTSLSSPAPWTELESKHLVLSVPTAEARKIADPVALMRHWDEVMEAFADLDGAGLPKRPERIVADVQISAGYMHSGYPIMTWLDDSVPLSLDLKRLTTQGTWGHWHELGHNRQSGHWTFDGTGEVTNNVYTVLAMQRFAGKNLYDRIKSEREKVAQYKQKPDFEKWKSEPFLALTMYVELIETFGWDAYRRVMRDYQTGPFPRNDQEKRDQWMTRFSKVVGRDLAPFFKNWGVPVSPGAVDAVRGLPAWSGPATP